MVSKENINNAAEKVLTLCENCICELTPTDFAVGFCTQCGYELEAKHAEQDERKEDDGKLTTTN